MNVNILGHTNRTGNHQSGIVVDKGSALPSHNVQINGKTRPELYGELVIIGGIGRNDRENRDSMRVLSGDGCMYALKAHIALEPPLVLRRYERDKCNR